MKFSLMIGKATLNQTVQASRLLMMDAFAAENDSDGAREFQTTF